MTVGNRCGQSRALQHTAKMRSSASALLLTVVLAHGVLARPAIRDSRHQHLQQGEVHANCTLMASATLGDDVIDRKTAEVKETAATTPAEASDESPDEYDPEDYPADTTGTLHDSESVVKSWVPEMGVGDTDEDEEDYQVYPDELPPSQGEPDRAFFTDLEDYDDQGPSFQKLILLATARHRHRAHRVPPGNVE